MCNADVYYNAHMNVLEKVKNMQEERGWSTYKLALESGLTQSTLSNMFARGTCPTVDTLEKICDAFGITLSEFFEEDIDSNEPKLIEIKYKKLSEKRQAIIRELIEELLK